MNKQELIKKYEDEFSSIGMNLSTAIKFKELWIDILELDEPQKPVVPQFVADWLKYCKFTGVELQHALNMEDLYFYNYANQKDDLKLKEFFETENNQDIFARAWLDGYTVEKEKRYLVKAKGVNDYGCYLNKGLLSKEYFWESKAEIGGCRTKHTRKQLEDDDFGWVFDCPGIEIQEVEELQKRKELVERKIQKLES